ncbi:MAG TPA: serine/threonine-protein kinase [Myxococcaceae bacterium]|jgi:uncharacterized protein YgiM (DUF1202 family)
MMTYPEGHCPACGAAVTQTRCEKCGAAVSAGGYRVKSVLAQTPHSRMYVAEDPAGRKVALKELLFAAVPSLKQVEAFEREGALLQELDHPRIPKFLSSFKEGEGAGTRLYVAQELVEGESLWQRLHAGAFDEPQARDVAAQVLDVLAYLHGRAPRVIHRDVKPHNLILRPDGSIALVDFGAARELLEGVTHQSTLVGTYGYMPPDQIAGTVDATCDLYALGASLMHLLTGRPPEKLIGEDLELGANLSLNSSPEFERFVHKLAAKIAAKRFPTAEAAAQALKALPPLKVTRGKRAPRVAVAAAAGAALVIAAAGVVWKVTKAPTETTPAVAPAAAAPVRVWAWEPKVQVYEAANANSALSGKVIPIGIELMVDRAPGSGAEFLQLQSSLTGFVRSADVRSIAPRYDEIFEASRRALGDADLKVTEAERAHALRPHEREPLALLLALYNEEQRPDDARRINDLLKPMGAAPSSAPAVTDERAGPGPKPEESWFIGATSLRMRKKPASDAKVLAELSINEQVQVVAVRGDWAEVTWERPIIPNDLSLTAASSVEDTEMERVQGFVAQAYLVRETVDKDWTLTKAAEAERRNDGAELERQLARAAAIVPDRDLELRLAKAAVAVRDYPVAASAAVTANVLATGANEPLVELKLAYRCRGDRNRAEWIDDSASVERMPDDACIESLEQGECEPCECSYEDFEARGMDIQKCVNEGPEARGVSEEELPSTCEREYDEAHTQAAQTSPFGVWQEQESARTNKLHAIDLAFPEQSWLRVKVRGPARASPDKARIVVYGYSVEEQPDPECMEREEGNADDCECESATAAVSAIDAGPMPPPGKEVSFWVEVPGYAGPYGVVFGKSLASVASALEKKLSACGAPAPGRTIAGGSTEATGCGECQCT